MPTRIALIALAALLALPLAPTASPVEARKRPPSITRSLSNVVPINLPSSAALPSPVSARNYPSDIAVAGLKGTIRDVNLRLLGFSHTNGVDVEVLLVGPGGQTAIVMANVGVNIANATLRLDDEARRPIPQSDNLGGTWRPTNYNGDPIAFSAPAPSANANAALSVFDGANPNGAWRLFVQDDFAQTDPGAFAGGWALEITAKVKAKKKRR